MMSKAFAAVGMVAAVLAVLVGLYRANAVAPMATTLSCV
jgi:hypothetical protein